MVASSVASVQVENVAFPAAPKAPGSANSFFLGGAGVRGLQIEDKFVKFTAIGIYLQDNAVPSLAVKWNAKTSQELTESVEFFRDIVTDPKDRLSLPLPPKHDLVLGASYRPQKQILDSALNVQMDLEW